MRLCLLGNVAARAEDGDVELRGAQQRSLLALLLLERGAGISRERLVDELWHVPPKSARHALEVHASSLRKALRPHGESDRFVSRPAGYAFRLEPGELDLERFETGMANARDAAHRGEHREAATAYRNALALWNGDALGGLADAPFVAPARRMLEEARLEALAGRVEAELAQGLHLAVLPELRELADEHPHHERLAGLLMLTLYRGGRQADALATFRELRLRLDEELGLEPGRQLRELEQAILRQDQSLELQPRASGPMASHPLPRSPGVTIGRDRDIELVLGSLVSGERLITLTGPGGVGKTRLALEVAQAAASRFETIAFVDLTSVNEPDLVLPAIAQAIGVREDAGRPLIDELARQLAATRMLLVVDNVEHVRGGAPALARLLVLSPTTTILCTSRTRLAIADELEAPVGVLARRDAIELFVVRARRRRRDFAVTDDNASAVAEICARLDGLPLAIELAASRIEGLSPAELLSRLERPLTALVGGNRDAPARHHTMRTTIAWSVDLLDGEHREVFDCVGVFVGGWTLTAAAALCTELSESVLLERLSRLAEVSLVQTAGEQAGQHRFAMFDTVRALATSRLAASGGLDRIHSLHAEHFARLAEMAEPELVGPRQAVWMERLRADLGNLRAAATWAAEHGEHDLLSRLVGSLWHFWERAALFSEAKGWLGIAIDASELPRRTRASALIAQAKFTGRSGDYPGATELLRESATIFASLGDPVGEARARANLAWVSMVRGHTQAAIGESRVAVKLAEAARYPVVEAEALNSLACALLAANELDEAERLFQECLVRRRELGDEHGMVAALGNLGLLALRRGRLAEAEERLEESLLLARLVDDPWYIANICVSLAYVTWRQGTDRAENLLREGVQLAAELGEVPLQAEALDGFAVLAACRHDGDRAAVLAGAAEGLRERVAIPGEESPSFRHHHAAQLDRMLEPAARDRALSRGKQLSPADALALALGDDRAIEA